MKMAGIEVTGESVIQGLKFEQRTGSDNQPYILATYTVTDKNNTPYTMGFIAEKNEKGEWRWKKLRLKHLVIFTGISI